MYIHRLLENSLAKTFKSFPITALIGPRQCGKSTLAKHFLKESGKDYIFLDLEKPSDLQKTENAEWFFNTQQDKIICIDEIQRRPELFPCIRSLTDEWGKNGSFLILGSASRDLLKQSSETLAGRIAYKQLSPFLWSELNGICTIERYFESGGFPRSLLAKNSDISLEWRENFISSFLERDLLQWANFTPSAMRRLWQMLAHLNGQTVNYSNLGNALAVSNQTVKNYIDLLSGTYMVDVVLPYISNLGKRLVKAPKVYISDSGIAGALLGIKGFSNLLGHVAFGAIWEQIVLSNIKGNFPNAEIFYYRSSSGAEMDFVVKLNGKIFAVECKASFTSTLSKGNFFAIEDISPERTFVVSPSEDNWSIKKGIDAVSISGLIDGLTTTLPPLLFSQYPAS
ncbi:MAG: ATP-binding protein [Fibromonadaceae bacterium]|jgi:predicted AAA+ superfamily ATPase|nr:ATP-binding protein [Fibromonadaceae bacterium]